MTLLPSDDCPNCDHKLHDHEKDSGCQVGWAWDKDGIAVILGCPCNLALVD